MNASERNADLFRSRDAGCGNADGEIRLPANETPAAAGPAGDAANDIGARLKQARESRGMTMQVCGQALRLPVRVLARLEAGDFGKPEDHVFTRGALQSYARLLDVPAFAVDAALRVNAPPQQPALIPTGSALRGNWLQRYGAAATYIVLTATVAVPLAWLGLRGGLDNQLTRIAPLDQAPVTAVAHVAKATSSASKAGQDQPLLASMTPFSAMNLDSNSAAQSPPKQMPAAASSVVAANRAHGGDHVLSFSAHGDSWFEVADASGKTLEAGLLHAGETRSYRSAEPLDVTIGNADAVQVRNDGEPLSLDAYRHANVARFKVFAPGEGNG